MTRPSPPIPLVIFGSNYKGGLKKRMGLSGPLSRHNPAFACQRPGGRTTGCHWAFGQYGVASHVRFRRAFHRLVTWAKTYNSEYQLNSYRLSFSLFQERQPKRGQKSFKYFYYKELLKDISI